MKISLLDELIAFVREEYGLGTLPVNESSRIEEDLGIAGDEHWELIRKYAQLFNVDVSKFPYQEYVSSEPGLFTPQTPTKPITIGNLKRGIEIGKLDNEVLAMT